MATASNTFPTPGVGLARDFGPVAAGQLPLGTTAFPTNHSGITIVTFCDGHTDKLLEDTPLFDNNNNLLYFPGP